MIKKPKLSSSFYFLIIAVITIYNLPTVMSLTGNMGEFISKNVDNQVYSSTVVRMLEGIYAGNLTDAFSGSNFSYGFGYFILLALFTSGFYWSGSDFGFAAGIMSVNVIGLILIVCLSVYTYKLLKTLYINKIKTNTTIEIFLLAMLLCFIPSANYILRTPRPEIWQAVFFLASIISYIKFFVFNTRLHLAVCSICLGVAVGLKVSLAPVAFVFGIFIIYNNLKVKNYINIIIFILVSLISCAFFTNPILLINPSSAINYIFNEFAMAKDMLNTQRIADFDYCFPVSGKIEAIYAWLTYPYASALIGFPVLLVGIFAFCIDFKLFYTNKLRALSLVVISLHVVNSIFLLYVSTTISSFYLLCTFIPITIILIFSTFNIIKSFNEKYSNILFGSYSIIIAIFVYLNLVNINGFNKLALYRFSKMYYANYIDFNTAQRYILESELPKGSVFLDPEAILPFNSFEWDYKPHGYRVENTDYYLNRKPVSSLERIIKSEGRNLAYYSDLLIISKFSVFTQQVNNYINNYKYARLFENSSVVVLSKNSLPDIFLGRLNKYEWVWDNVDKSSGEYFRLQWTDNKWLGTGMWFSNYVSFKTAKNIKLKFDLFRLPGFSNSDIKTLRLSFTGLQISNRSDEKNVWDYELRDIVKEGANEITIPLSEFKKSTGRIYWGYLNHVGFGGQAPGWSIKMNDIVIE